MARIRKNSVSLPLYDTGSISSTTDGHYVSSIQEQSENASTLPEDFYDHDAHKPHNHAYNNKAHGNKSSFWRLLNWQKLLAETSRNSFIGTVIAAYAFVWLLAVLLIGPSGTGSILGAALWGHEEVSRTGTSFRRNKYISKQHPIIAAAQAYVATDNDGTQKGISPQKVKFTTNQLIYPDLSELSLTYGSVNDDEEEEKLRNLDDKDPSSGAKRAALEHARAEKLKLRKQRQAQLDRTSLTTTVFRPSAGPASSGPPVVLVLALNPEIHSIPYMKMIIENRKKYAEAHGYGLYVRYTTDFKAEYAEAFDWEAAQRAALMETDPQNPTLKMRGLDGRLPKSKTWTWAKLAVLKHALLVFPEAKHFWYLDAHAVITDVDVSVTDRFVNSEKLGSIMMRDAPLKLPRTSTAKISEEDDSDTYHYGDTATSVKTYKYTQPENVRLVVTQERTGVSTTSLLLSNLHCEGGRQYAHALLDHWRDPLVRSYPNYRGRETTALNHILLWHPSFLARTALVPTTEMAPLTAKSLMKMDSSWEVDEFNRLAYKNDDKRQFVAVITACQYGSTQECLDEIISLAM